ncbi:MAG: flagellar hook-associated protein FlgK [Holophagales bacterium]|jgi:flagellar hook-associated protein 1 FlgK|nr:flagellar hook-associated protein FlgK [Holophagales bacterium]
MYLFTAGLGIGLTGLQAAQNGINVTGQNITNINTPGYSRQRVNLSTGYAVQIDKLQFGLGVNVTQIQSIKDRFLEMQLTQTITRQVGTQVRYEGVENIAALFVDNGESGLGAELQKFFQSFQELAARPENDAVRTNVVTRAQILISGMKSRYSQIEDRRAEANRSVASIVNEVNSLAQQIARLNNEIATEIPKGSNNNARDQRQAMVDQMAELVGIQVYEDTQGRLTITVENGMPIVSGSSSIKMVANTLDANGQFTVEMEIGANGEKIDVTSAIKSGRMGGLLDLRDNILPGYLMQLDQLAAGVVYQVNQIHRDGVGLNDTIGGRDFFVSTDGGNDTWGLPNGVGSGNSYKGMVLKLGLNEDIVRDPRLVAACDPSATDEYGNSTAGPGNNDIALLLADLQNKGNTVDALNVGYTLDPVTGKYTVGNSGPFSNFISSIANKLGNEGQSLRVNANTDENIRAALEIQRDRLSAVDMDEEATNLIVYQRSYQACTRFVNVINQLTDQLINNFGR